MVVEQMCCLSTRPSYTIVFEGRLLARGPRFNLLFWQGGFALSPPLSSQRLRLECGIAWGGFPPGVFWCAIALPPLPRWRLGVAMARGSPGVFGCAIALPPPYLVSDGVEE
jgi:hypothetical protein